LFLRREINVKTIPPSIFHLSGIAVLCVDFPPIDGALRTLCVLADVCSGLCSLSVLGFPRCVFPPPLGCVSLDSCFFGFLSLIRACFQPVLEVKDQLNLLWTSMKLQFEFRLASRLSVCECAWIAIWSVGIIEQS